MYANMKAIYKTDEPECYVYTQTVKIPYIKRNGKWQIEKATEAMTYFMDCRFGNALKAIESEY